jgi:tetratricopeptide (TPR) repeat protein
MKLAACLCLFGLVLSAAEHGQDVPVKDVFDRAAQALAASDYAGAERGFQAVLRAEPRNIAALSNLGVIYSRTNRSDEAIAVYKRALQSSPNDKALLLNLGLVYLRREDHKQALPFFERVVEIDPQHRQARQLLAVCRVFVGELEPAIRDLETLSAGAPHDENILFLLGFAYLKNHDAERARADFERMLETAGPVRAEFLAGKANYEALMFPEAEKSYLRVLQLDPKFPGVHLELGKVYIRVRRNEEAVRELDLVLKEDPDDADANYLLGSLLVQENRCDEAVAYLERAKKLKPDSWAVYLHLGKAKIALKSAPEAVVLLQRAVELNPDESTSHFELARALQAVGRKADAGLERRRAQDLAH